MVFLFCIPQKLFSFLIKKSRQKVIEIETIEIKDGEKNEAVLKLSGKIIHDLRDPKSRRLTGGKTEEIKKSFKDHCHFSSSALFKSRLSEMDSQAFKAGNFYRGSDITQ